MTHHEEHEEKAVNGISAMGRVRFSDSQSLMFNLRVLRGAPVFSG